MPLDVTILEVPARFGAMQEQLRWIRAALDAQAPGDVVVLPETCLTGYVSESGSFDCRGFGEPLEGRQLDALRGLARDYRTAVIGPVIERQGDALFNAHVVVTSEGSLAAHYRKRHPWFPETWATPGGWPHPRFVLGGLQCTLAICFDVHFLEAEARDVLSESDVLFFCSAWVDDAGDSRPGHLQPLAEAFHLTIVNANWGPGQPRVAGQGGSMIVGPTGDVYARTTTGRRLDAHID